MSNLMQQLKENTPEDKALKSKKMQPEWKKVKLGEIASFRTGPFGSALHKSDYIENGIPLINPMHIIDGQIVPSDSMTVPEYIAKKLNDFRLEAGEIIIGRRGDMGRCAVVKAENKGWLCGTGSMIVRGATKKVVPEYLQRVLSSPSVIAAIEESSVGSTMINLNQGTLSNLDILLPSYVEQSKIANALIDTDTLIISLEKLIAKKRAIKTATMQQLLTGKKRLPPFDKGHTGYKQTELGEIPEDWEVCELSKFVGALEAGISVNSVEDKAAFGHGKAILKTSCISRGYFNPDEAKGVVPKDLGRAKLNPTKGSIIISRMNTPDLVGEIGYVAEDFENLFLPDRLWQTKYRAGESVCGRWLAFILTYPAISKKIKDSATGTSNSMKNISKGSLLATLIPSPSFDEQEAIADVLSGIDKDLDALGQRLIKTQQLKQGMMQELLTGKTRLIASSA